MNRYQHEFAALDRLRQRRLRIFAVLATAAVTVLALCASGFQPALPWGRTTAGPAGDAPHAAAAHAPLTTVAAAKPSAPRQPLPGLDSSVSAVAQRLYLVSTSPGRNAKQGTARLGTSRENPQTYVAGALLVNGARLSEIYSDRVILERRGQRTTLYVASSVAANIEGVQDLAMVGGADAAQPAPGLTPQVDAFVDVVRVMPFYENDVLAGVQVFPGQKFAQFAALGLQSKDVIVAIDGTPVFDANVALERLRALSSGAALTVTARRGPATTQLALDGSVLRQASTAPGPPLPRTAPL